MSTQKGVTFVNQPYTAEAAATENAATFFDCILKGCEIAHSGQSITISRGRYMVCGRQIHNPGDLTLDISPPVSDCFARLKIQIDKNKTSSVSEFDQCEFLWEYSGSNDFPDLIQEHINEEGIIYEATFLILEIKGFGIANIQSRMITVHEVKKNPLPYTNGYVDWTQSGGSWYCIDEVGWVTVHINAFRSGGTGAGQQIATLPEGYRPTEICYFPADQYSNTSYGWYPGAVRAYPDGSIGNMKTASVASDTVIAELRFPTKGAR